MNTTFPEKLKAARHRAGLTLQQVADMYGVTKAAVSHWETGKRLPPEKEVFTQDEILRGLYAMEKTK